MPNSIIKDSLSSLSHMAPKSIIKDSLSSLSHTAPKSIVKDALSSLSRTADRTSKKVFFKRRKGCPLSLPGTPKIDYKNPSMLEPFISSGGRILPTRITNVCAKKQRMLNRAIKIARRLALLPYVGGSGKMMHA